MNNQPDIDQLCINTIRTLCIDAVQAARSGHPGTPMAMAPVAYCLWQRILRFCPDDPIWPDRDRFVLSMGHASTLLYSLLHLTGVQAVNPKYETLGELSVPLESLKKFRQIDSRCPGHPEYRWTSGVETTTGPLGQGVATSVGMAMASRWMGATFNRDGFEMFQHNVYAMCGDGCLMEGVSSEAASLAGHLGLSNLCWIYDSNRITIEGSTSLAFTEDVAARFLSYGWHVIRVADANDLAALEQAFQQFLATSDRPTLIVVESHIGWGSPNLQDSHAAHGAPLGETEVRLTKRNYGWPEDAQFLVPPEVPEHFNSVFGSRGRAARQTWMQQFEEYRSQHPELADQLYRMQHRQLPDDWHSQLPTFPSGGQLAGREASATVLQAVAKAIPWLIGGSADLSPSTLTRLTFPEAGDLSRVNPGGRNIHFGVREHAMASILNGLSLSKLRPFGSGFFIFSDYARGSIRLSALMEIPVIHIFTHDSIGVGEDGPTHQPIEQLASFRAMPGICVFRPADANEVSDCWKVLIEQRHKPALLVLSRQKLTTIDRDKYSPSQVSKGAYVLTKDVEPMVILMASGSEVELCLLASESLATEGIVARVVSMPSWELFEVQTQEYRDSVFPPSLRARLAVEAAGTFGWEKYVGLDGVVIGMESFGASAPLLELQNKFGLTTEHIVSEARKLVKLEVVK